MDRLHLMNVFVAVAEEQGFAAAARRLAMSPPAVTRAISALEERLAVKLLNRTTRYVRATEAGLRYLEDARKILHDVDIADEAAAGINAEPQGHLTVTAPVMFGQLHVIPGVVEYLKQFPKTQVNTIFLDRIVNLLEEGIDVGIRIGELPDSSMRALKVGSVRTILVASPVYIEQNRIPNHPEDLHSHSIIASNSSSLVSNWQFKTNDQPKNSTQAIRLNARLNVNSNLSAIEAAQQGFGITRILSYQASKQLESGHLKILLADYEPEPLPINIVHREGRLATTKVRAFIDLMAQQLRSDRSLN
jgi:DNA-binding transcriptional LysR family regulator